MFETDHLAPVRVLDALWRIVAKRRPVGDGVGGVVGLDVGGVGQDQEEEEDAKHLCVLSCSVDSCQWSIAAKLRLMLEQHCNWVFYPDFARDTFSKS